MAKLKTDENGTIVTTIIDEELDGIDCKFNNDGCVELNTDSYSYICLSKDNLALLHKLIEKAEKMYEDF